jgi:hypothetical protein
MQFSIQREIGSGSKAWVVEGSFNGNLGRDLPFWLGSGEHILPDAYHKLGPYGAKLNTPVPNPIFGQIAPTLGTGPKNLPFGRMYSRQPFCSRPGRWVNPWNVQLFRGLRPGRASVRPRIQLPGQLHLV